ncbi:hypothetical protein JCM8202_006282 [Rhodotorula sphaerocarpa]
MSSAAGPISPSATPLSGRRYQSSAGYPSGTSATSKRKRRRLLVLLGLLALIILLTVVIVPPSVVLTRKNSRQNAVAQEVATLTTVIDGMLTTVTREGGVVTRSRLSTLPNGQVETVTSVVALPDVTVSETSVDQIQTRELLPAAGPPLLIRVSTDDSGVATEYVTTTLSDGVVAVLQTATALETQVATSLFDAVPDASTLVRRLDDNAADPFELAHGHDGVVLFDCSFRLDCCTGLLDHCGTGNDFCGDGDDQQGDQHVDGGSIFAKQFFRPVFSRLDEHVSVVANSRRELVVDCSFLVRHRFIAGGESLVDRNFFGWGYLVFYDPSCFHSSTFLLWLVVGSSAFIDSKCLTDLSCFVERGFVPSGEFLVKRNYLVDSSTVLDHELVVRDRSSLDSESFVFRSSVVSTSVIDGWHLVDNERLVDGECPLERVSVIDRRSFVRNFDLDRIFVFVGGSLVVNEFIGTRSFIDRCFVVSWTFLVCSFVCVGESIVEWSFLVRIFVCVGKSIFHRSFLVCGYVCVGESIVDRSFIVCSSVVLSFVCVGKSILHRSFLVSGFVLASQFDVDGGTFVDRSPTLFVPLLDEHALRASLIDQCRPAQFKLQHGLALVFGDVSAGLTVGLSIHYYTPRVAFVDYSGGLHFRLDFKSDFDLGHIPVHLKYTTVLRRVRHTSGTEPGASSTAAATSTATSSSVSLGPSSSSASRSTAGSSASSGLSSTTSSGTLIPVPGGTLSTSEVPSTTSSSQSASATSAASSRTTSFPGSANSTIGSVPTSAPNSTLTGTATSAVLTCDPVLFPFGCVPFTSSRTATSTSSLSTGSSSVSETSRSSTPSSSSRDATSSGATSVTRSSSTITLSSRSSPVSGGNAASSTAGSATRTSSSFTLTSRSSTASASDSSRSDATTAPPPSSSRSSSSTTRVLSPSSKGKCNERVKHGEQRVDDGDDRQVRKILLSRWIPSADWCQEQFAYFHLVRPLEPLVRDEVVAVSHHFTRHECKHDDFLSVLGSELVDS